MKSDCIFSSHYPIEKKLFLFKYTFFTLRYHFRFCFTLEVEGVLFFLIASCLHKKLLEKNESWKGKSFHCKIWGFCFLTINAIQSFSFQLYKIIIDYLFQVFESNVKTMFGCDTNKSIFSDKTFQSYSFCWKKDLLKFFLNLFI